MESLNQEVSIEGVSGAFIRKVKEALVSQNLLICNLSIDIYSTSLQLVQFKKR